MQFNSTLYIVFLTLVVFLYYLLSPSYRRPLLLLASYAFYWVWSVPFSLLLFLSTFVDYTAARVIEAASRPWLRHGALIVSLAFNLGSLCLFKYADFLSDSFNTLLGFRPWPELNWILPLGISFYTFQTMSYTIDVYRGIVKAKRSLLDVALYVCFFPQLVAGPIVRSDEFLPQLECKASPDWVRMRSGIAQIIWGMVKKVYIGDPMGLIANHAYSAPENVSGWGLLLATYAFAIQIYCDFSGYSDIAIGSARLLGIELPENFRAPYLACTIRDFWRRWHITLSTWLRDYLYIPLGGSRRGSIRTYVNLMLTMLLGGLWHGAGWNWVVWGGLQGGLLCLERATGWESAAQLKGVWRGLRWLLTFHLVCLSWVFFRSHSLSDAMTVLHRIVTLAEGWVSFDLRPLLYLTLLLGVEGLGLRSRWLQWLEGRPALTRWATYAAVTAFVLTFAGASSPEFIYFQF